MIDNKNIPDADQMWPAAEKMLDRHFRKRRIVIWFFSIAIPAFIISLVYLMGNFKDSPVKSNITSTDIHGVVSDSKEGSTTDQKINTELNKTKTETKNITAKPEEESKSSNEDLSKKIKDNYSNLKNYHSELKKKSVQGSTLMKKHYSNVKNTNSNSNVVASTNKDSKLNSDPFADTRPNTFSNKSEIQNKNSKEFDDRSNVPASNKNNSEVNTGLVAKIGSMHKMIDIDNDQLSANEKTWPKNVGHACSKHIGLEAAIYGGAQYVQKTLSTNSDASNYLQHRKNEEDPVIMPALGISLTANYNSFSLSIGAEYSIYGEKTNYYPYSNQQTINSHSDWNTYTVNFIDTDIAYVTGNRYYFQTMRQRLDSSFVTTSDTSVEYKYDKHIAESNGVNKLYYFEMPVELSYCISKGKAGIGISGGFSPAWLVEEKGNYLRSDGKGIESFSDITTFRKFLVNGRLSVDLFYRIGDRTKLMLRPQYKANLNSIFENSYGVKQKYYSTGILFGVSYMLN